MLTQANRRKRSLLWNFKKSRKTIMSKQRSKEKQPFLYELWEYSWFLKLFLFFNLYMAMADWVKVNLLSCAASGGNILDLHTQLFSHVFWSHPVIQTHLLPGLSPSFCAGWSLLSFSKAFFTFLSFLLKGGTSLTAYIFQPARPFGTVYPVSLRVLTGYEKHSFATSANEEEA